MVRMTDVNVGALAQAVPDQVPSFGNGQASILLGLGARFEDGRHARECASAAGRRVRERGRTRTESTVST